MKKKEKYETNKFYHYAELYRQKPTEESEILAIDFTDEFYDELYKIYKKGELINMNINAPPTSGKTITGLAVASVVMKKCMKKEFGIKDIDRDQQEFSKTMRDPKIENTIRVIDEWNELETTGENSSVETALYNYFSDVMAQRFVHKISCSPKDDADKNALIYLEVISTDKVTKHNICKLYYKLFNGGFEIKQLLGHVKIYVGDILEQKWYEEYRKRKFEKMGLILEEGIFRPRILEYAEIITDVVQRLKKLTKLTNVINANVVRNYIKIECRKRKIVQSIIGEELATREVNGILDLYKSYWKIHKDVAKINSDFNKGKMTHSSLKEKSQQLNEMKEEITNAIKIQEDELKKYKKINDKYNKVLT